MSQGYFRQPTVAGNQVVFVSEDDLWSVPLAGGIARRLTSGQGNASTPVFSPDGTLLAFTSSEESHAEVYAMPAQGGPATRLTFLGGTAAVVGFTPDGRIAFCSGHDRPFGWRAPELYSVAAAGGEVQRLPFGPATNVSFGPRGAVVIGRHTADPARWKRYRGGTAGKLWVDADGSGQFAQILGDLDTNFGSPMWIGDRIFCISDHEGTGNIYSVASDGSDLRRHTHHDGFYARFAATDGTTIVYGAGADLYRLDPSSEQPEPIEIDYRSPRTQRNRKFVDAGASLQGFSIHPDGSSLAIEARGKALTMPLWEGAPRQWGARDGVRYRLGQWLADGTIFVTVSDRDGDEGLDIFTSDDTIRIDHDFGRPISMSAAPTGSLVAVTNHRWELILVDVDARSARVVDRSVHARIDDVAWSPDSAWLAYGFASTPRTQHIRLLQLATDTTHDVTRADFRDYEPAFDPDGKYLYFLSAREFDPVYDSQFFDLGFPASVKPMLVTLQADTASPFVPVPRALDAKPDATDTDASKDDDAATPSPVCIDLDGIADRVLAFPLPAGDYGQVRAVSGRALFTVSDPKGALGQSWSDDTGADMRLESFAFEGAKHEVLVSGISMFELNAAHKTIVYRADDKLRAIAADAKPDESVEQTPGRESGWIDLSRLRISIEPAAEWRQMLREAWRLQRDHFWTADMSGIDWPTVLDRYEPLVDRVASRSEFSDLMWELQGELGTSHAYEMGGDHRHAPAYRIGFLGADIEFDAASGHYRIARIPHGDSWDGEVCSPLAAPGLGIAEGDTILAISGQPVDARTSPSALLVNQAATSVELRVADAHGANPRTVTVATLSDEQPLRYRDWVEHNRRIVHERSGGKLGYVHVPDMGAHGYSEFHRYFTSEIDHVGLVVDVRYNGGGHVSQLLLEKLMRKRTAYCVPRYGAPEPYPNDSVLGPLVAITNEKAGSDGDIFSHSFKQLGLGPLVGTRTWGGVIGIDPSHRLADGSLTTQPEYAFWFSDADWGVENRGVEPTHPVEITPQQHVAGEDPQLDAAISLAMAAIDEQHPELPEFLDRPVLAPPALV